MPVDPHTQSLLDAIHKAGAPPLYDGSDVEGAREAYRAAARATEVDFAGLTVSDSSAGNDVPVRIYRPDSGRAATVVFIHGGGWVVGDLDTHDRFCTRIARDTGATVVSVHYRRAPEHPFPAAYDDCWSVLSAVADGVDSVGGGKVAIAGDSAGGNIAAALAQRARDEGVSLAAALLLYPCVDLAGNTYLSRTQNAEGYRLTASAMQAFESAYAADADRTDARLSPLYGGKAGLCPTIIAVAGYDPLRDEGTAYAEALHKAGTPVRLRAYPSFIHGFFGMAALSPACDVACGELTADLAAYL